MATLTFGFVSLSNTQMTLLKKLDVNKRTCLLAKYLEGDTWPLNSIQFAELGSPDISRAALILHDAPISEIENFCADPTRSL